MSEQLLVISKLQKLALGSDTLEFETVYLNTMGNSVHVVVNQEITSCVLTISKEVAGNIILLSVFDGQECNQARHSMIGS
jgi:hypothetical protein